LPFRLRCLGELDRRRRSSRRRPRLFANVCEEETSDRVVPIDGIGVGIDRHVETIGETGIGGGYLPHGVASLVRLSSGLPPVCRRSNSRRRTARAYLSGSADRSLDRINRLSSVVETSVSNMVGRVPTE
jgi:hypothetical protein